MATQLRKTASGGRHFPSGGPLKRHVSAKPGKGIRLRQDHAAVIEGRSLFPSTVVPASESPRLLVEGKNQRKIGNMVTKGRWAGMPIFTLTLEERATCPRSCLEWSTCYGNRMHMARRHRDDGSLMILLAEELEAKSAAHPQGFVVRLHILGDFYSADYARFWRDMLATHPELHVFGFTAHPIGSEIGRVLAELNTLGDRCWIRFSGNHGAMGSVVIPDARASVSVLCPVQTGKSDCCATCGLCWTMQKPIEFVRH